jgi:hypothetical protein
MLAPLALAVLAACAATPGPAEVTRELLAATSAGDVDAAAHLFAEDARWVEAGALVHGGREAVRARLDFELGLGARRELTEIVEVGDGARATLRVSSALRDVLEVPPEVRVVVLATEGGLLRLLSVLPDPAPDPAAERRLEELLSWIRSERPEDWAVLAPEGELEISREAGQRLLALGRAWRAAGGG